MKIEGISAIVTGSAGGIGRAVVHTLLQSGAGKIGLLDRRQNMLDEYCSEIAEKYSKEKIIPLLADVRHPDQLKEAFDKFASFSKELHLLVNNAGVLLDGAIFAASFNGIKKYSLDDWRETIDSNLTGVFLCSQLAVEFMVKKRVKGLIVNITSISRQGRAGQSAYSSSKGGIASITFTLAQELATYNIRCCGIAPGLVDTPMAAKIPEAHREAMLANVAVKRMGQPEEIAHGVKFCIENEFFNGRILEIDGGVLY